ncbi:MAG: aspartyl/asparaginyl beta-hydroxylase domain-containing protein [Egibacteraceae bacterium]
MQIASGISLVAVLAELEAHPELWGQHPWRKNIKDGPHSKMDDIWLRFAASEEDFHRPHFAVWYPAIESLPSLRPLIFWAMGVAQAEHLGGVLITRIPAGKRVDTHVDRGWHPEFYNCKLYIPLQSNPKCIFRVEDERVAMEVGDMWYVDNTREHDIINDGDTDRVTLIMCMRTD